jgi:hypothetical protein
MYVWQVKLVKLNFTKEKNDTGLHGVNPGVDTS